MSHERGVDDNTRESKIRLKRGRPIGSKDKNPRKRKEAEKQNPSNIAEKLEEINNEVDENVEHHDSEESHEINYIHNRKIWNRNKVNGVDDFFSYFVSKEIDEESDDPEPKSITE